VHPPPALGATLEALSIITHYSTLSAANIAAAGFALPGPLAAGVVSVNVNVHHASVALTACITAIQNAPPHYPVLAALPRGTYICHVNMAYKNTLTSIAVYK
jgi:hypothetical protein